MFVNLCHRALARERSQFIGEVPRFANIVVGAARGRGGGVSPFGKLDHSSWFEFFAPTKHYHDCD